ncbi:hypothetical protein GQ42DRAFT_118801, partial [Ramicandelaber brevisporus]
MNWDNAQNANIFSQKPLREPIVLHGDVCGVNAAKDDVNIQSIADTVGHDVSVPVFDVGKQSVDGKWTLGRYEQYFESTDKSALVSARFSIRDTAMESIWDITPPSIVQQLSLTNSVWPRSLPSPPRVDLYCLISPKDAFIDSHVDMSGSASYHHILSGSQIYYLVQPTPTNLRRYELWQQSSSSSSNPKQSSQKQSKFFSDVFGDSIVKQQLSEGNTLIIPHGWIYAVLTTGDSIVINGNFMSSQDLGIQTRVADMEQRLRVPASDQFPRFSEHLWHTA